MPTFNTFDPARFPESFSNDLQAIMIKSHFEIQSHDELEGLDSICGLVRESKHEKRDDDSLTKTDIELLYRYSRLSEAAVEILTLVIAFRLIHLRAKSN